MIETKHGNVLDVPRGIIVHGCNAQGVMGSGIALEVKNRFPEVYNLYRSHHIDKRGLVLGDIHYVEVSDDKFIVNAITQNLFWRPGSGDRFISYDAIVECFEKVRDLAVHLSTHRATESEPYPVEVLFPLIGAVRGGGNWQIIEKIIDETIPDKLGIKKTLYLFDQSDHSHK